MARELIALLKAKDLKNPKVVKAIKKKIRRIKAEAQYEEDRKYYGTLKVTP